MKRKLGSSASRCAKVEEVEEMQRRSYSKWRGEAESEEEIEKRDERSLALSTTFMTSTVQRERTLWLWWSGSWSEIGTLLEHVQERAGKGGREGETCAA